MFDINLLKKPGILNDKQDISNISVEKEEDVSSLIDFSVNQELNRKESTKNYLLILVSIGLSILIIGSVLNHNKINQENSSEPINISTDNLFDILEMSSGSYNIDYIYFINNKISFKMDVLNENNFYDFLNSLDSDFSKGIKAIHKENKFFIIGEFPWFIKYNDDFTINFLDKEISDFILDIRKEIYKDKLIIICGIKSVFELLSLIKNLNLIDKFQIRVEEIQTLPGKMNLYQVIIH